MKKIISGMVFFTLIAKLLGFVRELLLSYFFGASGVSDAYLISQTIPGTIFQFVGTGLTTCFIPAYYRVIQEHDRDEGDLFTNKVLTMVLLFSTIVMVIVWFFTPTIVKIFASGFAGDTLQIAVWFTRISVSSLYFSSLIYVYNSYLQANSIFSMTAAAAIPNSLTIIVSIILGAHVNIFVLSVGSALATAVQLFFLWIPVHKLKFRLKIDFHWNNSYIKYFFSMIGPVVIGVSVNEINTLLDRTIASSVAVGGISALTYANSLIMLVQGGCAQPIAVAFYPKMTKNITEGKYKSARDDLYTALQILLLFLLPITIGFVVLSKNITMTLFGRGAFDNNAIVLTATALSFYAIGMIFVGIRELLARYYYAYGNTKLPMLNSTMGMAVNIFLNLTLSKIIGIGGLALATSIAAIVTVVLMWCQCGKLSENATIKIPWKEIGKSVVAAIFMGGVVSLTKQIIPINGFIQLFLLLVIGIISYGGTCLLLHIEIVERAIDKIR